MKSRLKIVFMAIAAVGIIACGGNEKKENTEHADHADHSEMDHSDHMSSDGAAEVSIPEGAKVMFGNAQDGDELAMPYTLEFQVEGMEVEPAGKITQGKGHHHLIINGGPIPRGMVVPSDSLNIHYGQGQTEAEIDLAPGEYTLTMQFADGVHQSYGEQLSATVKVMVK